MILTDLIEVSKKLKELGFSTKHLTRNLRKSGYTLHNIRRLSGRSGYALSKEDAEKYLLNFTQPKIEPIFIKKEKQVIEEQIQQQREKEGWISFRLASAGMPDLINIKPNGDGSFQILFEEVKGTGDGLRKEQYHTLELMDEAGIPTIITWI